MRKSSSLQKPIEQYEHTDKDRPNNPPVGLVDAQTDNSGLTKKAYEYDPHLEPQLQWAGKAERSSFEVSTVSLHVHERIDPRRIIDTVREREEDSGPFQPSLFEAEKKPLREAIEFYKHRENWSNRLVAGDSLLVMNSLLEKEGMGGKVQMVYFDPPYGIKYGSNFMPFVDKKVVTDGKDEDLTAEPEMLKAFRDTWELGIHSYLSYLRDRLLLAKELLHESGSIFVQISDINVHHVRELLDEVFGNGSFLSLITFKKSGGMGQQFLDNISDYLLWYCKDPQSKVKYHQLFVPKILREGPGLRYTQVESPDGKVRPIKTEEQVSPSLLPKNSRVFLGGPLTSQTASDSTLFEFELDGKTFRPKKGGWKTNVAGMQNLIKAGRIFKTKDFVNYKMYFDDFPYVPIHNLWDDTMGTAEQQKVYVVQTARKVIQRCILMTTDPGDLVLDLTCGSGTTAYVAENWGRRWITCDTSRVAVALAKQRLMTAVFDYFELAHPEEGVGSGFTYKTVPHITLKSIANNESAPTETLYDQPYVDAKKLRVTGPFTVEAVPAPFAMSTDESELIEGDRSIARSGETLRQGEWIDRLKDGIRGKGGATIEFTRVEPLHGTHFLQAEAETREDEPRRVVVCFGPEHAPLEQRLVDHALDEARSLLPKPEIVLFCAFQFDPEARKDIEEIKWPGIQLLEAQMDADLLTHDLKKKPRDKGNPGFWLIGQPDVASKRLPDGSCVVEVCGFDYYNPKTGQVDSGGKGDIAMWMLDPNYDNRSLFPVQVFFPMADDKVGWSELAKNLRAEIDQDKIGAFRGTTSLPFKPGPKVAVKIIDARGIESLKIIHV